MAYLLNEMVFLDDCCFFDGSVVFNARASMNEMNRVLEAVYGVPIEPFKDRKHNSVVYRLNGSEVRYIEGRRLNVRITPLDKEARNRLEERLRLL